MTLHSEAVKEIDLDALRGHTPGPWPIPEYDNSDVSNCSWFDCGIGNVWKEADANLVSFAPDLLAELTTRRARDAEVAELVAAATPFVALLQRHNEFDETGAPVNGHTPIFGINDVVIRVGDLRMLRAALLPFQRSDDKGDAT